MSDVVISIGGVDFEPLDLVPYRNNYLDVAEDIHRDPKLELSIIRALILDDLWFLMHFVLKVPRCNHHFVVSGCNEVQARSHDNMLWLWAREHYKSSTLSFAKTIQDILKNPEERIAQFSYTKAAAGKFVGQVKDAFERNELLRACFPDVLWEKPESESSHWSLERGIVVKRRSHAKEPTLEACGLLDGMPTGSHYTKMRFDDIETLDLVRNPEQMEKCKDAFDMAMYLGSDPDDVLGTQMEIDVIGTYYHHLGPLTHIRDKQNGDGSSMFHLSLRPGTVDGRPNGASLLLSPERMNMFKASLKSYYTQILLNPTPKGEGKLDSSLLRRVHKSQIPEALYKFILVDAAGGEKARRGDAWAILLLGVDPYRDDKGASDIYLLNGIIKPMEHSEAIDAIVSLYLNSGRVLQLGVEKVGISTTEIHIANALRSKGKIINVERKNLRILRPEGRKKEERIESNLQWPLQNGKIHVSSQFPTVYLDRLMEEMDRFPVWHDDGIDCLSYIYDILKTFKFPARPPKEQEEEFDPWEPAEQSGPYSWLVQ